MFKPEDFFNAGLCDELKMRSRDVRFDGLSMMGVVEQSNSDSNSDISVSESVATNRRKLLICGESEKVGDNMSMPFIDFLGVGAI